MKTILLATIIISVLLIIIILHLFLKIRNLTKKLKYVDEANMWHKLAITDELTGLYNRNAYNLKVLEIKKDINKTTRAIMLFDVNDFKLINDTKGHLAGDAVLIKIAEILTGVFSGPDYTVFRIGGDEFLVLSENVIEDDIINRLILLKKHLELNGNIGLSKGYSLIKDNPEKAFKYADEMLYADKLSKKRN